MSENIINLIISIVGIILGLLSTVFAYLQLKSDHRNKTEQVHKIMADSKTFHQHFAFFTPISRIFGYSNRVIGRNRLLLRLFTVIFRKYRLIVVNGLSGVGKTALVAKFVTNIVFKLFRYKLYWVNCSEKKINLESLFTAIINEENPHDGEYWVKICQSGERIQMINFMISFLSKKSIILVIDDTNYIDDQYFFQFLEIYAKSISNSVIVCIFETLAAQYTNILYSRYVMQVRVSNLSFEHVIALFRSFKIKISKEVALKIYQSTDGLPALVHMAVSIYEYSIDRLFDNDAMRDTRHHATEWCRQLFMLLTQEEIVLVSFVSFSQYCTIDMVKLLINDDETLNSVLIKLHQRHIVDIHDNYIQITKIVRDYAIKQLDHSKIQYFSRIIIDYFANHSKSLIAGVNFAPSYGKVYLESHPDYVNDTAKHYRFVVSLYNYSLQYFRNTQPTTAIVFGSGHGIHDEGLFSTGLQIYNVEILLESIEVGLKNSNRFNRRIKYIHADFTKTIPIEDQSADIIFQIGTSFGFTDIDIDNQNIFNNVYRLLKIGGIYVFHYINGQYWFNSIERHQESTILPNGSIRTKYKVINHYNRTSLDIITLLRNNGEILMFHHFLKCYTLEEILSMLKSSNLQVLSIFGEDVEIPFEQEVSQSMIIYAQKVA